MTLGKKYYTGVVWQDFQHKQLMDLFLRIKEAKAKNAGNGVLKYSVAFLAMYVNHHFKLEEEYMDIYYYPDADLHKKEHRELVKKIKSFRKAYESEDQQSVEKLIRTLRSWIRDHILKDDKNLGDFILKSEQSSK